ncbi:MAG TPA: hypothetical protein DD379_00685 [Cyanobacteria bacterium UBA11162]|nr:hypothetical protein [Cyanobacteria bacterium UBA11162]
MLPYVLALVIGLGSFAFYMAAFFFPEVHRKNDFLWSGVGLFYALILWVCAGRVTGAVLLSQMASVSLLGWLGWQTLILRRQLTVPQQQTPVPTQAEVSSTVGNLLSPQGLTRLVQGITSGFKNVVSKPKPVPSTPKTPIVDKVPIPEAIATEPPTPETPIIDKVSIPEAIATDTPPTQTLPVLEETQAEEPTVAEFTGNVSEGIEESEAVSEEETLLEFPPSDVSDVIIDTTTVTPDPIEEDEFEFPILPETSNQEPVKEEPVKTIAPTQKPQGGINQVTGFFKNLFSKKKPVPKTPTPPPIAPQTKTLPEEAIALADELISEEAIALADELISEEAIALVDDISLTDEATPAETLTTRITEVTEVITISETLQQDNTVIAESITAEIVGVEIKEETQPTPTPETTQEDSIITDELPPVEISETPKSSDISETPQTEPAAEDDKIAESPKLIRPNRPDPKLVEAAKKSADQSQSTETATIAQEEIIPESELTPPAEGNGE